MSENSTPPERPLNSIKLTLHTHTQAHTHIFFSFKNTSARASIVQGGQSTAWSGYVWHIYFFVFNFMRTVAILKEVEVVSLQCITQRMSERQLHSLKVKWVTVTVGDHRTSWMPSHLWQCTWYMSQVCGVMENNQRGFHCHLALLTWDANIQSSFLDGIRKLYADWPWICRWKSEAVAKILQVAIERHSQTQVPQILNHRKVPVKTKKKVKNISISTLSAGLKHLPFVWQ